MHWMFLHLLAAREGNLMFLCSVFMLFLEGVSLQEEPGCIGSGVTRCLSVLVFLFLVFMLVLERSLVVRGGVGGLLLLLLLLVVVVVGWKRCGCKSRQPKKKTSWRGVWGGGRCASPTDALDVLASLQPNSLPRPTWTPRMKTQGH